MNPIVKNILAIIVGLLVGSIANMGIIIMSSSIIPPPEGVNPMDMEDIKANMHLYGAVHFIFPFIAHAVGTLVGALLAGIIAANNKVKFAMAIGVLFLIAGISNLFLLPSPMWFNIVDIAGAYLPMAWIGWKIAERSVGKN